MSDIVRYSLRLVLRGSLLAGGYSSPPTFVDARSARGSDENPLVPGSMLRGALREACVQLENARSAEAARSPEGGRLTRELFGAPGPDRPRMLDGTDLVSLSGKDGGTGVLRVGDARLRGTGASTAIRHGVGVDRMTGAAYPEVHFQREIVDAPGEVFEAELECAASDPALALLRDALVLVSGVGNSQSRGLGAIKQVELVEREARAPRRLSIPDEDVLLVRIRAREPLLLGGIPEPGNVRRSLTWATGAAIRGALAGAALRSGVRHDELAFQAAFVDPETCLLFSDAFATDGSDVLPMPAPRSRLECKRSGDPDHARKSGTRRDVLLADALAQRALAGGGALLPALCGVCDRPLTTARGLARHVEVRQRVVTRLGRDVARGASMPGLLYSIVQLEPGTRLAGTVARAGAEARALLARIDPDAVTLGGGRSRGLGRVAIELVRSRELGPAALRDRLADFEQAAAPMLEAARELGVEGLPDRLLAVVARTDLAVPPEQAPAELARALFGGAPAEVFACAQATAARSGWSDEKPAGPRPLRPVVAAGSAWIFGFSGEPPQARDLARLEAEGVGAERELGLGRLAIAPTELLEGWTR